ncbi:RNA-directed DNA polymerase [Gossypium australe]|uniref:RNA-directed DNA polymerase n=1 Tax=Gossypium australe TaxID=47621 RepID=A0A5B6WJI9_9ROSI|nr:RNA-directed DNA polymerase [Gossypium australe]
MGGLGWKIMMQPNCFFARVIKGKYYLNSEFLKASLGSHPCYTWWSIWSARGLLEEGLVGVLVMENPSTFGMRRGFQDLQEE